MRSILAGIENKVVRLPDDASAEIGDQTGNITIIQSSMHAIILTAEQMVELIAWAVVYHLGYLGVKADEAETRDGQCFECREPLKTAYVYRLEDGDIELCARCHTSVKKTVEELQRCSGCGENTVGKQTYTVKARNGELVEVCFGCFAEIAEGEFQATQMEYEDSMETEL